MNVGAAGRGQKIGRRRCGKPIEAKPVSGQTCLIEPADGPARPQERHHHDPASMASMQRDSGAHRRNANSGANVRMRSAFRTTGQGDGPGNSQWPCSSSCRTQQHAAGETDTGQPAARGQRPLHDTTSPIEVKGEDDTAMIESAAQPRRVSPERLRDLAGRFMSNRGWNCLGSTYVLMCQQFLERMPP
ncbi:hypothetical protein ABIF65_011958 [Bradyrhizobium japonicum]